MASGELIPPLSILTSDLQYVFNYLAIKVHNLNKLCNFVYYVKYDIPRSPKFLAIDS